MRKLMLVLVTLVVTALPVSAQIAVPNTFVPQTRIQSALVNENFSELGAKACNRVGCTMTGTFTSLNLLPGTHDTYAIGSVGVRYSNVFAVLGNFSGAVATGALTVTGAASVSTTLSVGTTATVGTTLSVLGASTVGLNFGVGGNTALTGTLGVTGATTVTSLAASGNTTLGGTVDVASSLNIGSGNVDLVGTDGRLNGPLSSTILDDLSGVNLTGVAKLASANTYTARNDLLTYSETKTTPVISAGALTINLANGTAFTVSLTAAITSITVSNPVPSGSHGSFVIKFVGDGTVRAITWPASFKWQGNTAPAAMTGTSGYKDYVTCVYDDGGTSYNCAINQNFPS